MKAIAVDETLSDIEQLFDTMNEEMTELKKTYSEKGKNIFKLAFKEFFENNAEVSVFGWRQYTPYFNDGDACTFRTDVEYGFASNATDYSSISRGDYDGEEEGIWIDDANYGDFNYELIPKSVVKNIKNMRKLLSKVDDDLFLDMFGDHATVYVTREGFYVEEFNHE
jgi:hypothetical protein